MEPAFGGLNMLGMGELERTNRFQVFKGLAEDNF